HVPVDVEHDDPKCANEIFFRVRDVCHVVESGVTRECLNLQLHPPAIAQDTDMEARVARAIQRGGEVGQDFDPAAVDDVENVASGQPGGGSGSAGRDGG